MTAMQTPTERLKAARAAFDAINVEIENINKQMRDVEWHAQPAEQAVSQVQSLKQQRRGILTRMLRSGEAKTAAPEVWSSTAKAKQLDAKISDAENGAQRASAVLEAKNAALAELQAEATRFHQQLQLAKRELVEAQFEAATAEIREQALPEFLAACDALQVAYGRLAGLGVAHCELAQALYQQHGITVSPLGTEFPVRGLDVIALGFGLGNNGGINNVRIDAFDTIVQAKAEALTRWRSM